MGPTALLRPTIRARGYKRNLVTEILVELTKNRFGEVKFCIVPPLPRLYDGFGSAASCLKYFTDFQLDIEKMAAEMEFTTIDIMGQVSESGLADLLSSDQIHWSDKGRALVRAVISRHIATTKY